VFNLSESYKWEAEKKNGDVITLGGDLSNCIRFSLIPQIDIPKHDFVGIFMVRRFCRTFQKKSFGDLNNIPGGITWEKGSNLVKTHDDLRELIKSNYFIRQQGPEDLCPWCRVVKVEYNMIYIEYPYSGRSAINCNSRFSIPMLPIEHVHCVVCLNERIYVKSSNGSILVTPKDYELYM